MASILSVPSILAIFTGSGGGCVCRSLFVNGISCSTGNSSLVSGGYDIVHNQRHCRVMLGVIGQSLSAAS